MVIFHSYVKLPEGNPSWVWFPTIHWWIWNDTNSLLWLIGLLLGLWQVWLVLFTIGFTTMRYEIVSVGPLSSQSWSTSHHPFDFMSCRRRIHEHVCSCNIPHDFPKYIYRGFPIAMLWCLFPFKMQVSPLFPAPWLVTPEQPDMPWWCWDPWNTSTMETLLNIFLNNDADANADDDYYYYYDY